MKQTGPEQRDGSASEEREMRSEYRFDYATARPNRFVATVPPSDVAIVLDEDVAKVFSTAESVNTALRALIAVVPIPTPAAAPARRSARKRSE